MLHSRILLIAVSLALHGALIFPSLFAADPPRRVYVPLEDLDVVLEQDPRGVLLKKDEFERLTALAHDAASQRPRPPGVAFAWTTAVYQARAVDDQLLLTVRAELQQFVAGWRQLAIPLNRTAVESAKLDGDAALIGRGEGGALLLFVSGQGRHVLELELSTELSTFGADRAAAFGLLPAPSATFELTVPAGKHLQANGWQLARPGALDQPADYKLSIGGQDSLHLKLTDRGTDKSADVLAFATTGYGLHVMPGEVSWHALTTLQVFGKPLAQLTITAPNFLEIADIESSGLEAWELVDDPEWPEHTRITLTYRQPFDGGRKITFKGVMATSDDAPWTVPTLNIANVTSHVGQVVVQYPAGVRLQATESQGVRRATLDQQAASDMPIDMGRLESIEQLRFDFWQTEFVLRFLTQPRQRDVQTAVAAVLDVNSTGLDLAAAITVKTRFAPLFELDLDLPSQWTLLSVSRDGQALTWQSVSQTDGRHLWRIPLSPALAIEGLTTVQLSIRREVEGWPVESEPVTVELPELILPQSNLHEGTLVIRGDEEFDLAALQVSGLDAVPLNADYERLRFQSQDTRYTGQLKISRKPSRVSVESVSFTRLDPQTIHALLQAVIDVQGGGVRTLQISLPESTGSALRFQAPSGPRIVEQTVAAPQNGQRLWTLQFDHRVRGRFLLKIDIELPRGGIDAWTVPEWTFVDAERQNGYIAIEASGEQRLTIDAKNDQQEPLTDVDALDLPRTGYTPKERIIAVYRTVLPGATVTITEQRFEKEPIPTAVCPQLAMMTVADRRGELQHRGVFSLKLVGVQNLSLQLPDGANLWATKVDGRPVEVRRGQGGHLIPLPGPSNTAERILEVYYKTTGSRLDETGTLQQSPPGLSVVTGTGGDQPVVVLEQLWKLYHPHEMMLVDSDGWLEPTSRMDEMSWLGRWQTTLRRPTTEQLGQSMLMALIAVAVAAVPILLVRRFGARTIAFGSVALGLLLLMGFLFYPFSAGERTDATYDSNLPSAYYANDDVQNPNRPAAPAVSAPMGQSGFGGRFSGEAATSAPAASDGPMSRPTVLGQDFRSQIGEAARDESVAADKPKDAKNGPVAGPPQLAKQPAEEREPDDSEEERKLSIVIRQNQTRHDGDEDAPELGEAENLARQESDGHDDSKSMKSSGRLSLSLDLAPPVGSQLKEFRYVGQGTGDAGAPLELTFAQRKSGTAFRWFLVALFALAGWLNRRSPLAWKIAVTVLGLALPLGLATIAPLRWQVLLDGVFLGTLAAAAVWIAEALCGWCERNCQWCCAPNAAKATGMLLAVAISQGVLAAQETKEKTDSSVKRPAANVIVIPYEAGTDPLAAEQILVPHDRFLELWRAAHPEKPLAETAPIDGSLMEALYAGRLEAPADQPEDAVIRFTARYTIRSHVDGPWSVPLPLGAVALSSATLNGKSAIVTPQEGGYVVVIPTAGLHVLDLEFSVAAKQSGTTGQFTLPLKAVPSGKLIFQLPAKELLVRINGSSTAYRKVTTEDTTRIELPIDRAADVTIAWQPPQAQGGGAAVVHVESVTAASISDAGITVSVGLNYRVRQGAVQDVRFAFPGSLKLQSVQGPDVGGWELQETPAGRELKILFRRAVNDLTQLGVTLFLNQKIADAAETFELPSFAPLEVTNEVGTVAVFAGDHFQVTAAEISGLSQMDTATYAPVIPISNQPAPPRAAYRFARRPFAASFQVRRQLSRGQLTAIHGATVMRRKIQSTSRFQYQLTGAPRSTLSFALPPGFLPLEVKATALSDWYVDSRGEDAVLVVQLAETRLGTVEAVITGSRPRDPADVAAAILLPQPLDISRLESTLALWTDESYLASIQSSDGWRSIDAAAAGPELQQLRAAQTIQFAFQSSSQLPKPVTVQLARGEPRLKADGLVTTTVSDFTVVHALALQWQIGGAAVESLSLTTPNSLSGRLDFQGPEIREVVETAAGDNRVRWTIWFRTPVTGKYFATGLAALPPAAAEVAAPSILCEQPSANGDPAVIENQRHYVLLINGSASQLTLLDPGLVETVQKDDLPITVRQELIDQGTELVRVKRLGTAPVWTVQKFALTESIPASVNVADLTTVIARDGTYRTQAVYTIKNRRRQFLALRLPPQAVLLSVTLNHQPSRCVTATVAGAAAHLIALPKTSEADLSFPVKIVIAGRLAKNLPRKVRWGAQEIDVPGPQVISQTEDASFGIPTARTRWTVFLAEDLDATPVTDPQRHNLTRTPEDSGALIYASAAVQELNELLDVVENSSNYRQKGLAAHNLKQLQSIVMQDEPKTRALSIAQPAEGQRLAEQQRKAVERSHKVQQDLQSNSMGLPTKDGNPTSPNLNFSNQAEVVNNAILGNGAIFSDNNGSGIVINELADETFQFELQQPALPQDAAAKESAPQQQGLQTRGAYQRFNRTNLDSLNTIISGKKSKSDDLSRPLSEDSGPHRRSQTIRSPISFGDEWKEIQSRVAEPEMKGGMGGGLLADDDGINDFTWQGNTINGIGRVGMGGMGGGMGGGEIDFDEKSPPVGWTQAGGLSLPIELPTAGQKFVFTKTGGDPQLTLSVRPKATLQFGLGLLWTAVWVIGALVLAVKLRGPHAGLATMHVAAWGLCLLGLIGWCLLPLPSGGLAMAALVVGTFGVVWFWTRPAT